MLASGIPSFVARKTGRWIFMAAALLMGGPLRAQENSVLQQTPPLAESLVSYPGMLRLFTDTVWEASSIHQLQVSWMGTGFRLERKYAELVTDVPAPKLDDAHYVLYQQEPQWYAGGHCTPHANCYTFGLYQAFRHAGIDPTPLFGPTTFVPQQSLEVLLATSFIKEHTLDATSLPALLQPIPVGSLLVFRGEGGAITHAAYQSPEGLLSKNGSFEPRIYRRLDYLKRVYFEAATIDLYRLDAAKVIDFLENSQPAAATLAGR